ncbi:MAG TPA: hypothetical protein VGG68_09310 [Caulobacteraceae bacterium]
MRQYGEIPPLSDGNPPAPGAVTGAAGARVEAPAGSGYGWVELIAGTPPLAAGSLVLAFASAPPTLFFAASDVLGPLTVVGQGTAAITVSWAAATWAAGQRTRLAFEKAVSF